MLCHMHLFHLMSLSYSLIISAAPGDLECLENIDDLIWQVPMVSGRAGVGSLQ